MRILNKNYQSSKRINSENCIFYLIYKDINISFIVLGYGPYIHSILFRSYSLMDPRFPIVALALKKFLKEIKLKDSNKIYLNTYSFMILLVSFLQDIIQPPILPKIFSEKNTILIDKLISFTSQENKRELTTFMETINYKHIHLPEIIFDKEKLKKLYNEQIGINKNNLSCAEILLYFLEYIIYYFKFDTLYVNCSLQYEGFDSMNNLLDEDENDEEFGNKVPNDIYFKEYYKKRKEDNKPKGLYLIRDPINPFYNPGDDLNNSKKNLYKDFFQKIKKGHDSLLISGSFNNLDKLN